MPSPRLELTFAMMTFRNARPSGCLVLTTRA
jgi:hypothetical protein